MKYRLLGGAGLLLLTTFASLSSAQAEVGVSETEIVIAETANLSGPQSFSAQRAAEGAGVFFDKLNATGGINGRKIKLVLADDKLDPKITEEIISKLEKDPPFLIFQPYGTATSKAIESKAPQVPLLFPLSSANGFSIPAKKNTFALRPRLFQEAAAIAEAAKKKSLTELAFVGQTDTMTADLKAGLDKQLKLKQTVLLRPGDLSLDRAVNEILAGKPQAIVICLQGEATSLLINKIHQKAANPVFLVASPAFSDELPGSIRDSKAKVYIFLPMPLFSDDLPIAKNYLEDSRAAGKPPSPRGFEAYINSKVLALALEKAGKDLTRESLLKSLESDFKDCDVEGLKIAFGPSDHQGLKQSFVYRLDGHKLVKE